MVCVFRECVLRYLFFKRKEIDGKLGESRWPLEIFTKSYGSLLCSCVYMCVRVCTETYIFIDGKLSDNLVGPLKFSPTAQILPELSFSHTW